MSAVVEGAKRGRGRPPAFDRKEALQQAMKLFWDRGYEGATFDELATAMGISPSSFHNSFGSKQKLFTEAAEFYLNEKARWFGETVAGSTSARQAMETLLRSAADEFTSCDMPSGCMISLAGTHVAPDCDAIRSMMASYRAFGEKLVEDRLKAGIAAGELPPDTDAAALAAYFGSVFRGMAVHARDGASRERLLEIGEIAMRAWPEKG